MTRLSKSALLAASTLVLAVAAQAQAQPAAPGAGDAPLRAEAQRILDVLEAERARLGAEYGELARRVSELEARRAARPASALPATDQQLAEIETARARLDALAAIRPDDPAAEAKRRELERFLAGLDAIAPVHFPADAFTPALSVQRARRALALHEGPDDAFPVRTRLDPDAILVVLAEETGGGWRFVVSGGVAGYTRSDDLREF